MNHQSPRSPLKLLNIDPIRGLAILLVFLYHARGSAFGMHNLPWKGLFLDFPIWRMIFPDWIFTIGWAGVAVFFAISGFVIHFNHRQDSSWRTYAVRRFFRIYPPYLLALLLLTYTTPELKHLPRATIYLLKHVFMIHNFERHYIYTINPSLWSIPVEVQLYLLYPLLLWLVRRFSIHAALFVSAATELTICGGLAWGDSTSQVLIPHFIAFSPFRYLLSWMAGAYLAEKYSKNESSMFSKIRFDWAFAFCFASTFFRPTSEFSFLGFSLLGCIATDRLINNQWKVNNWSAVTQWLWKKLGSLGTISYSFYLLHQPILLNLTQSLEAWLPKNQQDPYLFLLILIASILPIWLISYVFYQWIEIPSISIGKRLSKF